MKTKSLTTTFTQTVPNLDASEAMHYPSIDRNATFPPSNTSPTAIRPPVKSYAIIPTPTWGRTSAFTIQASPPSSTGNSNSIYTALIQRENHGFGSSQVLLQQPVSSPSSSTSTTLATCRLKGFASKKFLFLGQYPDCTDLADWIPVMPSAKFDPSKFFFEFKGEKYCWTRTRRKELGAKGWSGKCFKLKRVGLGDGGGGDGNGEVLAVYVHVGKWKKRDEGRVDWFCEVDEVGGEGLEVLSVVAVLGLEEEIRRAE